MNAERWHGSGGGYTNHHCRCAQCTKAHSVFQYAQKQRRAQLLAEGVVDVEHGRYTTYFNWSCRCPACRNARNAYERSKRAAS